MKAVTGGGAMMEETSSALIALSYVLIHNDGGINKKYGEPNEPVWFLHLVL